MISIEHKLCSAGRSARSQRTTKFAPGFFRRFLGQRDRPCGRDNLERMILELDRGGKRFIFLP